VRRNPEREKLAKVEPKVFLSLFLFTRIEVRRMPYVDSTGRIVQRPPLFQQLLNLLHSFYLAIALFLSTLLNVRLLPLSTLR
jgi:hypothetical protein